MQIANFIFKRIDKHERKNISRMFYILGSIAPDLKIAKHPKFKIYNDSIDLIKSKMESLESLGKRRFSYRLGVISHYITDYFCLAHNLQNTLKTRTHLLYEFRLARAIKHYITTHDFGKNIISDSMSILEKHNDMLSMIADKHKLYTKNRCDNFADQMFLDMNLAFSVCMALAIFVLN
ncbi:MAG: zinc dependent phospholipase C family protein, partial [Clostridiales bacterium]|nr:zinc dependent phospholipase C family protein [Clostridiales bacterium]